MSAVRSSYSEFNDALAKAKSGVERILDRSKDPLLVNPEEVTHSYDDKFALANHLTNSLVGSVLNVLTFVGVSQGHLQEMKKWSAKRSVSMKLEGEYRCTLVERREKEVESPELVTETKFLGISSKKSHKIVTKVPEWEWEITMKYVIFAYEGNNPDTRVVFQSREGKSRMVTSSDVPPTSPVNIVPVTVNITWLLQQISDSNLELSFEIDRQAAGCCTPRRNRDVQHALSFAADFSNWCNEVNKYFHGALWKLDTSVKSLEHTVWRNESVFQPLIPLFIEPSSQKELEKKLSKKKKKKSSSKLTSGKTTSSSSLTVAEPRKSRSSEKDNDGKKSPRKRSRSRSRSRERRESSSSLVSVPRYASGSVPSALLPKFFEEHVRSLTEALAEVKKTVPVQKSLISSEEAVLLNCMRHVQTLCNDYRIFVDFIEYMLLTQIIEAIGHEVTPVDFTNYMRYHNRNLFAPEFAPQPFSYAIRRPDHSPVGHISLEEDLQDGSLRQPIQTIVRHMRPKQPMRFALNAATDVTFYGDHYLHGYIRHQFSGVSTGTISLFARTREFSSFVVMVGKMLAKDLFEPACALILKNKDELEIPLTLTTIPSAKAFKKAVSSISDEQRRFAQAIRNMQLEGSLFGICIIQIQPQMERLLNLPKESLVKEIELSEQIQELFIKYQIPSDMLSYEEDDDLPDFTKVATVRTYVTQMNEMIHGRKETEIKEAVLEKAYNEPELISSSDLSDSDECEEYLPSQVSAYCDVDEDECDDYDGYADNMMELKCEMAAFDCGEAEGGFQMAEAVIQKMESRPPPKPQPVSKPPPPKPAPAKPTPAAKPTPVPKTQPTSTRPAEPAKRPDSKPHEPDSVSDDIGGPSAGEETDLMEYTSLPAELDKQFLKLDPDGAVCATTITPSDTWTMKSKRTLNSNPETKYLYEEEQMEEKKRAFELLDALSRSGALDVDADNASFHILLGFTHIFDQTLIDSLVMQNVNPIEKVERSTLIVASSIHQCDSATLVAEEELERASTYNAHLFAEQ